ncbi:uncharacterized protein LOC120330486 isoform X2 [Styela clava]
MRLPAHDIKPNEERKRRRRTVTGINNNLINGCEVKGELDEVAMARQEKVANFSHHKRVADYLLGKSVGEGSFAKVRLGLHVQTAEEVAIKVMSKARARKDAYVHKNLRREGRILQMARHKNIVQVYDILETDNNYYLVTEFCRGGELIDIVTDKGCLPENDVRRYIAQLVSAVAHLHDHGIVHRDLKVENLLLDDSGEVKIIDFGLSNVINAVTTNDPARALATQCGSPAYAAPELLAKNLYGPKVDVWSIGIITYALLVGKLPFTVEPFRIPKLCRKMLLGDMNPIPPHLSGNCRHFIRRLLVPDPDIRPTISQVQKMSWISINGKAHKSSPYSKLNSLDTSIYSSRDIDTDVIKEMTSRHGFEFSDVLNCVRKNRPGEALATYYLLYKQKSSIKPSEKRHNDIIGSDGNLDHEIESDKSSDEEEGLNDIDDVTDDVIFNGAFKKESLFKGPVKPSTPQLESKQKDASGSTFCNKTIVNDLIVKHVGESSSQSGRSSNYKNDGRGQSMVHHKIENDLMRNGTPPSSNRSSVRKSKQEIDRTLERLQRAQKRFEQNEAKEQNTIQNDDITHDKINNVIDEQISESTPSKTLELKSTPGGKSGKSERKSRGPTSMRDLMRTMSRARDVLQRRSLFGQSKVNKGEEKGTSESPELNKFRRLSSRNESDSGATTIKERKLYTETPPVMQWERRSPHIGKKQSKQLPNATAPVRVKLPETSPPPTPLSMSTRSGSPARSPLPSNGFYTSPRSTRGVGTYAGRPTLPQRIPSFHNRTSLDSSRNSDTPNRLLPLISTDRNHTDVATNPLGYSNLASRYHFHQSPSIQNVRQNNVGGTASGVKEIIEKFHALMNGEDAPAQTAQNNIMKPTSPRSNDATSAALSYLSSQRRKREEAQSRIRASGTPNGTQILRVQTNPTSTYKTSGRFTTPSENQVDYAIKQNEMTFASHFGREKDLNIYEDEITNPYIPKRHPSQTQSPEYKSPNRGVWYKSAV